MQETSSQTLQSRVIETRPVKWKEFTYIQQDDFKELSTDAKNRLKSSILLNNFAQPFYVWQSPCDDLIYCLDGKHRTMVMLELIGEGVDIPEELPGTFIRCDGIKDAAKLVLVYSSIYAKITEEGLFDFVKMYDMEWKDLQSTIDLPGINEIDMGAHFNSETFGDGPNEKKTSLQEKFIVPPFSILDTRQGYWQDRKKQWHDQGINSQETREDVELIAKSGQSTAIYELRNKMREVLGREPVWDEIIKEAKARGLHVYEGASVFDPVLSEIVYKWFGFPGAMVLDSFAGGSVRGIVAGLTGLAYTGIDLRLEQCQANDKQWAIVRRGTPDEPPVQWMAGDSNTVLDEHLNDFECDLVFSCPPYHDLEQYSEDPNDLSNMDYEQFKTVYKSIIGKSVARLRDNRFACFVVSEIRDKKGYYKHFVRETISAFEQAGCNFYNDIILINVAGSLPIRIGRQFQGFRKVGKTHQNVLVFFKGDIKKIPEIFPEIEIDVAPEEDSNKPELL